MKTEFFIEMLKCFVLTAISEGLLAWIIKLRTLREQVIVLLVNLLTNPLFVSICFYVMMHSTIAEYYIFVAISEILIFAGEGLIYKLVLKPKINPFLLSLILNLCSFSMGMIINIFLKGE